MGAGYTIDISRNWNYVLKQYMSFMGSTESEKILELLYERNVQHTVSLSWTFVEFGMMV